MKPAAFHLPALVALAAVSAAGPRPARAGQVTVPLAKHRAIELEFDGRAQVLFYPQLHDVPGQSEPDRDRVLLSQYALAVFLWEHPDYVVFEELPGADHYHIKPEKLAAAFPDRALPRSLADCTPAQRDCLVTHGAAPVLRALDRIAPLQACFTVTEALAIERQLLELVARTGVEGPAARAIVHDQRERLAAQRISAFLEAGPTRRVLLVFGALHDFRPYFPDLRFGEFTGMEPINGFTGFERACLESPGAAKASTRPAERIETKAAAPAESKGDTKAGAARAAADVDALEDNHRTPLVNAIVAGRLGRVRQLLAAGADPRLRSRCGRRPLVFAAEAGRIPVLRALLARLAKPDLEESVTFEEADPEAGDPGGQDPGAVTILRSWPDLLEFVQDRHEQPADGKAPGPDTFHVIQELKDFVAAPAPAGPA